MMWIPRPSGRVLRPATLVLIVWFLPGAMSGSLLAHTAAQNGSDPTLRLDDLKATRLRPLFSPTRRPPPPVIKPVGSPASFVPPPQLQSPPDAELTGIIIGPAIRIAVLKLKSTAKTVEVKPGDVLDGWRVLEIEPQSIAVESKSRRLTLELKPDPGHVASTDINKFIGIRNMGGRGVTLPLGLPQLRP